MTIKKQGEGFFIGTPSSEVPDIERGDLEQALKKAPLFLEMIFSHFCVFLAEQWNHDVSASSKTGILPNYLYYLHLFPPLATAFLLGTSGMTLKLVAF